MINVSKKYCKRKIRKKNLRCHSSKEFWVYKVHLNAPSGPVSTHWDKNRCMCVLFTVCFDLTSGHQSKDDEGDDTIHRRLNNSDYYRLDQETQTEPRWRHQRKKRLRVSSFLHRRSSLGTIGKRWEFCSSEKKSCVTVNNIKKWSRLSV